MNYATIKKCDIANGTGVRVSLFVSGCRHHCLGCFNEEAWDFHYGQVFNEDTIQEIMDALKPSHVEGLTLLGGEPMDLDNQEGILPLLQRVKNELPNKDIWVYSGYILDDLLPGGRAHREITDEILSYVDVLVDGPFVQDLKDISLRFRGSSNQRLIDLKETLKQKKVILYQGKDFYRK